MSFADVARSSQFAARLRPTSRMGHHDAALNLNDYRVAREIDGRPLSADEVAHLRKADQAMSATRSALRFGRGNVLENVATTHGYSYRLNVLGRTCAKALEDGRDFLPGIRLPSQIASTAAAEMVQAGDCGEFAHVAAHKLLPNFAHGEVVSVRYAESRERADVNHGWVEYASPVLGAAKQRLTAVIDAHSNAPVMLKEDTVYGRADVERIANEEFRYDDPKLAADASDMVQAVNRALTPHYDEIRNARSELAEIPVPKGLNAPMPIINDDFYRRVDRELMDGRRDIAKSAKQLLAARRVAEQNGCAAPGACALQANSLITHLRQSW